MPILFSRTFQRRTSLAVQVFLASTFVEFGAGAREAAAGEPPSSRIAVHVAVRAPRDCATADTFWAALSRRTSTLERATSSQGADAVTLVVTRRGAWMDGELTVVRGAETSDRRTLRGATCEEVVDGLSLIVALAFDDGAMLENARTSPEGEDAPSRAAPGLRETARREEDDDRAPMAAEAEAAISEASFSLGVTGGVTTMGVTGTSTVSAVWGGFVELARHRPDVFSPSIRAGFSYNTATSWHSSVEAELAWTVGRISVCPLRFAASRSVALRACLGVVAGAFSARATNLKIATDRSRAWMAPEISAPFRWEPIGPSFIEIQAAIAAPIVRDEIVVEPTVQVYRAPAAIPSAAIAAGVHLP